MRYKGGEQFDAFALHYCTLNAVVPLLRKMALTS